MGSLGSSLLESLGISGGQQTAAPIAPLGPEEMNPGMKMFGMSQPVSGGIPEAGAVPGGNADMEAVVRGFKPEKMNFWKRLADQFLIHQGQKPVYEQKVYNKNMQRAMEGFTQDPLETIRRIGTFDPKTAMGLYNQYVDNKRQDVQAERTKVLIEERGRDRAAAYLGAATPENYPKIRGLVSGLLERYGIDPSDLPEQYDPDAILAWRVGGIPVDDQVDNAREDVKVQDMRDYRSNRLGQFQQGINEKQRHNVAMENKPSGRGSGGRTKNRMANKVFKDSSGSLVEFDKTGEFVKVTQPSGRIVYYGFDANGNRVRIGVKEKE